MEPDFSEQQFLMNLGLTLVEAKVYLALAQAGPLRASAISKISKVNRPDVYRTIPKLQQLGLVEKIIKKPEEYKAAPINETISFLLQIKEDQYRKAKATAQVFLERVKNNWKEETQIDASQFILIPQGKHIIERIRDAIERAQQSIDLVLSWRRFAHGLVQAFCESLESAWARNVRFRSIIENPRKNKTSGQLVEHCRQKPPCQIRFLPYSPRTVFGLYDRKELFLIVFPEEDLTGSPALWSNNRSLIAMAEDHFEMLWLTAIESCKAADNIEK